MELFLKVLPIIIIVVVGFALFILAIVSTWKKIPNDHAAVIIGIGKPKVVSGGGTVVIPLLQRMDMITLETLALEVAVRSVKTSLGVPINAEGYVVIKVKAVESDILTAMQMFYCQNEEKTKSKIIEQAQKICEGKLREMVSGMTVEEIYDDRDKFSAKVLEVASSALGSIGLELKSFTINDITDEEQYIESLGKAQISKVKADAAIAQAEAAREQNIKTAEANRLGTEAQLLAQTQIAEAEKIKGMKVLEYKREQQAKQAEADAAYKIQENITLKEVTNTEMDASILKEERTREVKEAEINIQIAAEQKNIELAQKKAARREAELLETVIKPAEARQREMEIEADAAKNKEIRQAEAEAKSKELDAIAQAMVIREQGNAEAEIIKARGISEANAIREKGLAEAEALEKKAEALAKMNEAGRLQMVIDKLPEIARALSEPMSKIGNISIIGGGGENGASSVDVARMTAGSMKAIIDSVKDIVGFDLTEVMKAETIDSKITTNLNVTGLEGSEVEAKIISLIAEQIEKSKYNKVDDNSADKK